VKAYQDELIALFSPAKDRLPSYSTIRRVLLNLPQLLHLSGSFFYWRRCLGNHATDGKVLRGSYETSDDPEVDSHPAIMLI